MPGLNSMAPARLPVIAPGLGEFTAPFYGPNSKPPEDPSIGEEPQQDAPEVDAVKRLIGQFNAEIDLADWGRREKEKAWIKVEKYLAGKDVNPPPAGYTESTFFYRRLPRITQIGKAKLFKHVCPIHGRPWDIQPSPRHKRGESSEEEKAKVAALKEEIEDIQEAMDNENNLDDMCEYMSNLGCAVAYGPIRISQPRLRWQDGNETVESADDRKPMWEIYDPKRVYPDPNAKKPQSLEYVHFHNIFSRHQIRALQEDPSFIKSELAGLLEDLGEHGNWAQNLKRWELVPQPTNVSGGAMSGYCVWMRIGVLTADALETLGQKFPDNDDLKGLDDDEKKALTDQIWEIWFCDKRVLKVAKRTFQPTKIPVYFIPFRRDPCSIFGVGAGESALECVEMLTNITRSIDDALTDTSGFQVAIDAGMVENKDLTIQGRKTWIYRRKGRKDDTANHKPVDFFTVPSNLDQLLATFKTFESMVPICTGFLEMANGQDMGSGVRTDSMMNQLWDSLEEFIKDVVGNFDRYFWKPFLRDCKAWILEYYENPEKFQVEADLQVHGVRGALRREIVGRKAKDFFRDIHQFGLPGWMDEIGFLEIISEGMGIESEKAVLTAQQHTEKMALEAKKKEVMEEAGQSPGAKFKAQSSKDDALLEMFKQGMAIAKNGVPPPFLIPVTEKVAKRFGEWDDKMAVSFAIWAKMLAQQYQAMGVADAQETAVLEAPAPATNPGEVSPDAKAQQPQPGAPPPPMGGM
jgi:hypothetical protein